jgi:hypothetical protein
MFNMRPTRTHTHIYIHIHIHIYVYVYIYIYIYMKNSPCVVIFDVCMRALPPGLSTLLNSCEYHMNSCVCMRAG